MTTQKHKDDLIAILLITFLAVPVVYLSLFREFEGDSGDNIVHYYFARYAFENPMLYLDMWAKPVFTFLASPFARLGFAGMKLFNGLVGLVTALVVYISAKKLNFRLPWLSIIFLFFAPTYFTLLFSGYTEPLFGLALTAGFYFCLREKYGWAAVAISLTPFIRAEGFFIIIVFAAYFLLKKQWRALPWLLTGSLLLSFGGLFAGKSFTWIFTEIPYGVKSNYGSGKLTHYAEQWILAVGVPLGVSSVAGLVLLIAGVFKGFLNKQKQYNSELFLLLPAIFVSYFLFHTLSWYFGLFTSYGLIRVLVPLIPLQALISLFAIDKLLSLNVKNRLVTGVPLVLFMAYVLVFPFLSNPASLKPDRDFQRKPELRLMQQISREISNEFPGSSLYYSEPYFSYAFNINHFDKTLHQNFTEIPVTDIKPNSIIIWDNWTSVNFAKFNYDFGKLPEFSLVKIYKSDSFGREAVFRVYRKSR